MSGGPVAVIPVRVPAKFRLRSHLKEMDRVIAAMPEPLCQGIEAAGLLTVWRNQLETLQNASAKLVDAREVVRDVVQLANAVRRMVR
jgi:hypothetical protein